MPGLCVAAHAKLNLYLHILGRRADGYHLLDSLVVFTTLADTLQLALDRTLSLTVTGEFAGDAGMGEGNLVLKAAQTLRAHTGCTAGAQMTLEKQIPVGAGLGGGSADAAAALRGLNDLWQLGLSSDALHIIASTLGADVAMCLASTPAMARGIGDELTPLTQALPALHAVLVHPRVPLLTKDVYAAFTQKTTVPVWQERAWDDTAAFIGSLTDTRNHLQRAAITVDARVLDVLLALETLQPAPELVRMSGSGACCFALYTQADDAQRAAHALAAAHADWWIRPVGINA